METICDDLAAEQADLDRVVADLDPAAWSTSTPSDGWTVQDQIGHLAFYDEKAVQAVQDPEGFAAGLEEMMADPEKAFAIAEAKGRSLTPAELLEWWRSGRESMVAVFRSLDPGARVGWYGPPMAARTFATARLMEAWAHGQDVVDALGINREAHDRIRHICHLGVRTRGFSYAVRGMEVPEADVAVELTSPSGEVWTWGANDSDELVRGTAFDFCLVVTQRRHVDDTGLVTSGELSREWMELAQAFAGLPTSRAASGRD